MVEADVGGEAAADPRPAAVEPDHSQLPVVVVGEVVALALDGLARLAQPVRRLDLGVIRLTRLELAEDRRPAEVLTAAMRAGRHLVALAACDREAACSA